MNGHLVAKIIGLRGQINTFSVGGKHPAVIEATDMQSITSLLRPQMGRGDIQVLPVNDNIAMRKEMGNWGK